MFLLHIGVVIGSRHFMETQIPRESFVQVRKSDQNHRHRITISIKKRNIDLLEKTVLERSTPGSDIYQHWLSYDEVTEIIENPQSFQRVKNWLDENHIEIEWISRRKDFIQGSATIEVWERLLEANFFEYVDLSIPESKRHYNRVFQRATEYSIPVELKGDVFAIFNTVQTPPEYRPKYFVKEDEKHQLTPYRTNLRISQEMDTVPSSIGEDGVTPETSYNGKVTVQFLNSYYGIPSNIGSASISQSVFETTGEFFSTNDLSQFQDTYCLTVQPANEVGNHSLSSCPVVSSNTVDCYEGNLDIQYIMGVSQVTASIFWWVPDSEDPYLTWITEVSDEVDPPKSNSISYGSLEYVR
jgi:hypothetical protein